MKVYALKIAGIISKPYATLDQHCFFTLLNKVTIV